MIRSSRLKVSRLATLADDLYPCSARRRWPSIRTSRKRTRCADGKSLVPFRASADRVAGTTQKAGTSSSRHTPTRPPPAPTVTSSALASSRRSCRQRTSSSGWARRQTTSRHKQRSLSSSRNHSTIQHVPTRMDVIRKSWMMGMAGCVRSAIRSGQSLFTGECGATCGGGNR
jgi:hypothetical protein